MGVVVYFTLSRRELEGRIEELRAAIDETWSGLRLVIRREQRQV